MFTNGFYPVGFFPTGFWVTESEGTEYLITPSFTRSISQSFTRVISR